MAERAGTTEFWNASGATGSDAREARLCELLAGARAAYPQLAVSDSVFFAYLGQRYDGADVDDYLDRIDAAELYLVCGCLAGQPAALSELERSYLCEVRVGAARLGCAPHELDDIAQQVRTQLLAPRGDGPPRLATLTARGDLKALIRLMAYRAGVSLRRKQGREQPADDLFELAGSDESPSMLFAARQHRQLFSAALEQALAELDSRTRSALKLHCLDGVPLHQLATMYRVDRSTVSRWIARAREQILASTRRRLAAEAGVSPERFDSFVDVIRSNFELSLQRMLAADD